MWLRYVNQQLSQLHDEMPYFVVVARLQPDMDHIYIVGTTCCEFQ